ncbi:MAG: tetratricopeptide repeat protein [Victivallaceae bacterium]
MNKYINVKHLISLLFMVTVLNLTGAEQFKTFYDSGTAKAKKNDYNGAAADFRKALDFSQLSSDESRAIFALSDTFDKLKKYDEAAKWLERLFEIPDLKQKDVIRAYRNIISINLKQKKYDEALENCADAARKMKEPANIVYFYEKAAEVCDKKKDYPAMIAFLQQAISESSQDTKLIAPLKIKLLGAYYKNKQYAEALQIFPFQDIPGLKENDKIYACCYSGISAFNLKKYSIAISYLGQMPNSAKGNYFQYQKLFYQGYSLQQLKQYPKALDYYVQIINDDAFNGYFRACAMINSASIMTIEKKYDAALKYYENAEKLDGIVDWQKKSIANGIKKTQDAMNKK